jgi:ribosomal-protein-alanine N-acetyltransferase
MSALPPSFAETTFETERLWLEPLRRSHAEELFDLLSDERLYRFIPKEPPETLASLAARFQRLEGRAPPSGDDQWLNWVVRLKSEGTCVGRVEVTAHPDRSAHLAYEIGAPYWGRGLAVEACRRILEALFEGLGTTRVVAEVDTRNAASIRLLERLGFQRTGITTGADFFKGAPSDELTYELTPGALALKAR